MGGPVPRLAAPARSHAYVPCTLLTRAHAHTLTAPSLNRRSSRPRWGASVWRACACAHARACMWRPRAPRPRCPRLPEHPSLAAARQQQGSTSSRPGAVCSSSGCGSPPHDLPEASTPTTTSSPPPLPSPPRARSAPSATPWRRVPRTCRCAHASVWVAGWAEVVAGRRERICNESRGRCREQPHPCVRACVGAAAFQGSSRGEEGGRGGHTSPRGPHGARARLPRSRARSHLCAQANLAPATALG